MSNFFVKLHEVLNLCPITFHGKWEHLPSRQEVIIPHGNERCLDIILILWQQDFWTQTPSKDKSTNVCAWVHAEHGLPKSLLYSVPSTLYIPLHHSSTNFSLTLKLTLRIQIPKPTNASVVEKNMWKSPNERNGWKKFNLYRPFHACTSSIFWFWTNPSPHQSVTLW